MNGLRASLDESKSAVQDSADSMSGTMNDLAAQFVQLFALDKLKDFFVQGVQSFAQFDEQLAVTNMNLDRFGEKTTDTREELDQWAHSMQASTLFTKEQALDAVNHLVVSTGDLGTALKLSKLAMDVSQASGVDLTQAVLALGNAYQGNTSGLGRFTRAFPELKTVIEEGKDPIEYLEKHFSGMAVALGDQGLAGSLFHAKEGFAELGEEMAQQNQTAIEGALGETLSLTRAIANGITFVMKLAEEGGVSMGSFAARIESVWELTTRIFSGRGVGAFDQFLTEWNQETKDKTEAMAQIMSNAGDEAAKSFSKGMTDGTVHSKPPVLLDLKGIKQEVKDTIAQMNEDWKDAGKGPLQAFEESQAAQKAYDKDAIAEDQKEATAYYKEWQDAYKQAAEFRKDAIDSELQYAKTGADKDKELADQYAKDWKSAIKEVSDAEKQSEQAYETLQTDKQKKADDLTARQKETEESMNDFVLGLQNSSNKELAEASKAYALFKAVLNAFTAESNALADFPYPANLGVMALVGAQAGANIAEIEGVNLATGGITTGPVLANLHDAGESEMIVPLSKSREMGFGAGAGDTYHNHFHFGENTNQDDAKNAGESAGLTFLKVQQKAKNRAGRRNSGV